MCPGRSCSLKTTANFSRVDGRRAGRLWLECRMGTPNLSSVFLALVAGKTATGDTLVNQTHSGSRHPNARAPTENVACCLLSLMEADG
jgi:hypothetical protein